MMIAIDEKEFIHFLHELCTLYHRYGVHIKTKDQLFTPESIGLIISSGITTVFFSNLDDMSVEVFVSIGSTKKYSYTTSISDEVHIASIFMGTELFSNFEKTDISEVNFFKKKYTRIQFLKENSYWHIHIDVAN